LKKQTITTGIYGIAPIEINQDPRIAFNDLRTYIAIASYQGTDPTAFPGRDKVAERAGLSLQAVSKSTKRLESFGWLEKTRRFGNTTIYRCKVPVIPSIERRKPAAPFIRKDATNGQLSDKIGYRNQCDNECPNGCEHDSPNQCDNIIKDQLQDHYKRPEQPGTAPFLKEYQQQYLTRFKTLPRITLKEIDCASATIRDYGLTDDEAVDYIRVWGAQWKDDLKYWPASLLKFNGELLTRLDKIKAIAQDEDAELLAEMRRLFPDYVPKSQRQAV